MGTPTMASPNSPMASPVAMASPMPVAMASPMPTRVLYLLKKRDVPPSEQKQILKLQCYSIQRVSGISKLIMYLNMYTSDATHQTQPYILKRLKWNNAIELFGFDYDTSESDSDSDSDSSI
jgi:hypothetical protein